MVKKTLIIHTQKTSFVREDIEIISSFRPVEVYHFVLHKNPVMLLLQFVKQFFFLLFNGKKYDHYYVWFADYHAYFPILFSKWNRVKSFIVLGGYDTMSIPEIDYGVFLRNNLRKRLVTTAIRKTDYLLGVDPSMFTTTNYYIRREGAKQGVEFFVKNIQGKKVVMPTGYDPEKWHKPEGIKKKDIIVTIGAVTQEKGYKRKGFDFFSAVAKVMPEFEFIIIGPNAEFKKKLDDQGIPNLTVHSFMPQEELIPLIQKAKVYAQFSIAEGLPNSLCEAMLCECIPVGSCANGIPGAIEDNKLVLNEPDVEKAREMILFAMQQNEASGKHFRKLVIDKYPKSVRRETLEQLLI